jgi:hypothetical protein
MPLQKYCEPHLIDGVNSMYELSVATTRPIDLSENCYQLMPKLK